VTSTFTDHGLPLLFAAVAVESFGIPVPGETALIAFGVLASQGHYGIVTVIAVATAAAFVGDNLGFWLIGRRGGRALNRRYPWIERRTRHVLPRAEALIETLDAETLDPSTPRAVFQVGVPGREDVRLLLRARPRTPD
jgi:membrane protein DedA with SNARE-associated domain